MITISVLFGVISSLCYGISNAYWKTASKKIDYHYLLFFRGIFASTFFGILWMLSFNFNYPFFKNTNILPSNIYYIKTIIICIICSFGLIFYLSSLKYQPVSVVSPISSINFFNIITAVFVIGEMFHPIYYFSFFLAFLGILLSQNFQFNSNYRWNKGATYAILASLFWGVTYPFFKVISPIIGAIPLSFILEICVTFSAFFWGIFQNKNIFKRNLLAYSNIKHYIILGFLLIGGTFFFNLAIINLTILSLNLLSNLTIVTSMVFGIIFYKETLNKIQLIGIILLLLSILVSQYFI
jgi:drug/metabolite transporter (DMT)-like permease